MAQNESEQFQIAPLWYMALHSTSLIYCLQRMSTLRHIILFTEDYDNIVVIVCKVSIHIEKCEVHVILIKYRCFQLTENVKVMLRFLLFVFFFLIKNVSLTYSNATWLNVFGKHILIYILLYHLGDYFQIVLFKILFFKIVSQRSSTLFLSTDDLNNWTFIMHVIVLKSKI